MLIKKDRFPLFELLDLIVLREITQKYTFFTVGNRASPTITPAFSMNYAIFFLLSSALLPRTEPNPTSRA